MQVLCWFNPVQNCSQIEHLANAIYQPNYSFNKTKKHEKIIYIRRSRAGKR
jgi:hypothetical protein